MSDDDSKRSLVFAQTSDRIIEAMMQNMRSLIPPMSVIVALRDRVVGMVKGGKYVMIRASELSTHNIPPSDVVAVLRASGLNVIASDDKIFAFGKDHATFLTSDFQVEFDAKPEDAIVTKLTDHK